MTDTPLVSVIVIFLDAERYLEQAIASVLAQSYPNWELILVDDGSSDHSSAIAQRHAQPYTQCDSDDQPARIRYVDHPGHHNLGMSASRNLGAMHARGRYLAFLDADDELRPDALATLTPLLAAEPRAGMVYGPIEYWHEWPGRPGRYRRNYVQRLGVEANQLHEPPDLLVQFLRRRAAAPSGVIVRADVFRAIEGFENSFRGMYEDQAFCAKVCLTWPVFVTDRHFYRYRQHDGSSSAAANRSGQPDFGRAPFLQWLETYLNGRADVPDEVQRALRAELWWLDHPRLHHFVRRARRMLRRRIAR